MSKPDKEEKSQDTNAWMTTYTDLMTLLLTFFVLLLSLSVIDSRKQRVALNSLIGAFGFKPGAQSVMGTDKGTNITTASAPLTKEEIDFERLQNIVFKNGLESDVDIMRDGEKIVVSLSDRVLFDQGSTELNPDSLKFLSELTTILRDVPGIIEFRGYADTAESVFDADPLKVGMNLSAERALAAYHFLHDREKVPHDKMVAHGFGSRPSKKRAHGIEKGFNRQVEIVCDYRAKIPYRLREKESEKNILLDFKGFMFNLKDKKGG
jgi:chemotaxis protein MotB